jgi:DNA processing protein
MGSSDNQSRIAFEWIANLPRRDYLLGMSLVISQAEGVNVRRPYAPPATVVFVPAHVRDGVQVPKLYAAGALSLLDRPAVAVVGSRFASDAGRELASEVARELVAMGVVVVSGLAAGIDGVAHREAIAAGGRTIAVIGTPVERAFPREHARLQEAICRDHLVVSPFAARSVTRRGHFPQRNRVMARVARATVLIEAGEKSGTVHQVRESLAAGRPVFIAERLMMSPKVQWARQLWGQRGVFVWGTADEVRGQIGEICNGCRS